MNPPLRVDGSGGISDSSIPILVMVYEYMVNGSLEKYIHGGDPGKLDFNQLYTISLGTTRDIAYLHKERINHILHFDKAPQCSS